VDEPGQKLPAEASDADLMRFLAVGDMGALGSLVKRHQDAVRAIAYRMCGRWDVADDLAQEAFLRVHRSAGSYRPTAAFRTWLYRIVVNLCLDRARTPRLALANDGLPDSGAAADESLIRDEKVRAVQRAVAALPERQRMALVLHRFEGMTQGQIAQTKGWTESAVESLLTRAYQQLRQELNDWAGP
jgi:RNA polymerase sigma-70 factor, ECF subfamily